MIPEKVRHKNKIITNILLRSDRCSSHCPVSVASTSTFVLMPWAFFWHAYWLLRRRAAAWCSYFRRGTERAVRAQDPRGRATQVLEDQGGRKQHLHPWRQRREGGSPGRELRKRPGLPTVQTSHAYLSLNARQHARGNKGNRNGKKVFNHEPGYGGSVQKDLPWSHLKMNKCSLKY